MSVKLKNCLQNKTKEKMTRPQKLKKILTLLTLKKI